MQSPYESLSPYMPPAPPLQQRRIFSGLFKGLFLGILVVLLLSGGLGGWLLLNQSAHSSSVKPMATPQLIVHRTSTSTVTSQPTANSVIPTVSTSPQFLPGTWTQCALETATCSFHGTMAVAFGANGAFTYATESNGIACTNVLFGDPLYGVQKACYIAAVPPTTNVWVRCAVENATCSFLGTMTVAFGANGSYKYATKTNSSDCSTGVFGDPLYGVQKACYLISSPTGAATWKTCAAENSTCTFTGMHEVAYGGNGKYVYGSFTNGIACADSVFGDPDYGFAKACYYQ